jgi:hypothetical protein
VPCLRNPDTLSAPLHLRDNTDYDTIDSIYDKLGPTPRLCFEIGPDPDKLESYENDVEWAIKGLTLEKLKILVSNLRNLSMDDFSHKLCLIRRKEIHKVNARFLVTPITEYVQSGLAISMRKFDIRRLTETYQLFTPVPFLRGVAGLIFENICHQRFKGRIFVRYVPMVRLSTNKAQWHSAHRTLENKKLEASRKKALHYTLDVRPVNVIPYDSLELAIKPDFYYIPMKPNEVALDSFIYHKSILYIFQFTVSEKHSINEGLLSRLAECTNLPNQDSWRYIFIIPDEVKLLNSPFPTSPRLQKLEPFSAQVAIDETQDIEPPLKKKTKITEAPVDGSEDGGGPLQGGSKKKTKGKGKQR